MDTVAGRQLRHRCFLAQCLQLEDHRYLNMEYWKKQKKGQPSWVSAQSARSSRRQLSGFGKIRTTCAALDLLVEPLEHVRGLEMLVVLARQSIKVQSLADVRFCASLRLRRS